METHLKKVQNRVNHPFVLETLFVNGVSHFFTLNSPIKQDFRKWKRNSFYNFFDGRKKKTFFLFWKFNEKNYLKIIDILFKKNSFLFFCFLFSGNFKIKRNKWIKFQVPIEIFFSSFFMLSSPYLNQLFIKVSFFTFFS